MIDYRALKQMAKAIGRPVKDVLALAPGNDPYYAGVGRRGQAAEWFGELWPEYGGRGFHLRRIHYRLVSPRDGVRILLPNGCDYQNTQNDWTYLCMASLAARYLGIVSGDDLIDQRNDPAVILADNLDADPNAATAVSAELICDDIEIDIPEFPDLPGLFVYGLSPTINAVQDVICEVWIEKSTQNDWLVPLCQRRGVNLVVGIGEQSEVRSRELAVRSSEYGAPVRVFYISDFDPGGRSMPKAVARKVQFTIDNLDLDTDIEIIPLALSPEQCIEYSLPRTPIKDTERRKDKFESIFGVGATELDALEALHPGELGRLLERELDNFLDRDLKGRVAQAHTEQNRLVEVVEREVTAKHSTEIEEATERLQNLIREMEDWAEGARELWQTMAAEMEEKKPDLSDVEVPRSEAGGVTDKFILYDSKRSYFEQADIYNDWKDGADG